MLPSMFSGISGLKVNQRKLDVIGNNISNSSTTAFKSQRVRFQDMISQSMATATGASANLGGTNARQVGLGVQVAGIDTTTNTGSMQPTSRNYDAMIDGPGYFIVGSGAPPSASDVTGEAGQIDVVADQHTMAGNGVTTSFTRDGSFTADTQGSLVTSDGLRVYGYANANVKIDYAAGKLDPKVPFTATYTKNATGGADTDIATANAELVPLVIPESLTEDGGAVNRIQSFSIGKDGVITATLDTGGTAVLGQIAMASFKNDAGLTKMGKNTYQTSPNSGSPAVRNALGDTANDNSKGYGDMIQGALEMSNVDLAEEFTNMIIANRAFAANGKIISTGDEILQDLVNLKR